MTPSSAEHATNSRWGPVRGHFAALGRVVVDCMLPAAIAAARATGTPTASIVHFLYGLARTQMLRTGGGWTTDLRSLDATHRMLGLAPAPDGLTARPA